MSNFLPFWPQMPDHNGLVGTLKSRFVVFIYGVEPFQGMESPTKSKRAAGKRYSVALRLSPHQQNVSFP